MKKILLLSFWTIIFGTLSTKAQQNSVAFNDTVYAGDALENAGIHMTTAFIVGVGCAIAVPVIVLIGAPVAFAVILAEAAIIVTGAFSISGLTKMQRAGRLLKRRELQLLKH